MIIGIDGNEANVEKKVGIGEYAFELLRQFEQFRIHPLASSGLEFRVYLKDKPRKNLPKIRDGWKYRIIGPRKFWTQFGLPLDLFLRKPRPDIFFTPSHYAPRFSPIPTAVSVMDISYIKYPQLFKKSDLFQLKNWTAYSVKKASVVFTISQASKDDIIKTYGVRDEKVVVTYPGIKSEIQNLKQMQNSKLLKGKYKIEGEYILFVGTLQPRKNIVRLIEAFSKIKNEISLIIIGKKGWLYEEILEAPKKLNIVHKVKFLDFVPNEDLPSFYKNALCFILPSLYEGFGLPVLEAMRYGCPVITSNASSLPEAAGDAALYVNPQDTDEITEAMRSLIDNPSLRNNLIKKGYDQIKKFSWEKTARETLRVLEEVVSRGR